jgi:hypothetical protein
VSLLYVENEMGTILFKKKILGSTFKLCANNDSCPHLKRTRSVKCTTATETNFTIRFIGGNENVIVQIKDRKLKVPSTNLRSVVLAKKYRRPYRDWSNPGRSYLPCSSLVLNRP